MRARHPGLAAAVLSCRILMRLLPPDLRRRAGPEMLATCAEALRGAHRERGGWGLLGRWALESADLLLTAAHLRTAALAHAAGGGARLLAPALALCTLAVAVLARDGALPLPGADPGAAPGVVVSARDPAGEFSLTLRGGRIVAATLDRVPVPPHRLVQSGDSVLFMGEDGSLLLRVQVQAPGTIRWRARPPLTRS